MNSEFLGPVQENANFKFSKTSHHTDFQEMITQDQDARFNQMSEENAALRECLKMLEREVMDIIQMRKDVFSKRSRAEYGASNEVPPEMDIAKEHQIETICEGFFNVSFEEKSSELIAKFKMDLQRLKECMQDVDKEIAQRVMINPNEDVGRVAGEFIAAEVPDPEDKFARITSVQELRHLLKNYDALAEA